MKKSISMVSALIKMMTRPATEKVSEKRIFAEDLPVATKIFVHNNYPGRSIAFIEKVTSSMSTMYVITLNDGLEIVFNENENCKVVDCKKRLLTA